MIAARLALAALALIATPLAAHEWAASVDAQGLRRAETIGVLRLGERHLPATLALQCRPGADGSVAWSLAVADSDQLGFDFAAFEGPDAPAARRRLASVAIVGGLLQPRFQLAVGGYYDSTMRFVLQFGAPATAASEPALLAESVSPTSTGFTWRVADPVDASREIVGEFDLAGAAPSIRETMLGCGPPPPIDAAQREAWQGRRPAEINWFAQRSVQWRLKALLGANYDSVVARLADAEAIGVDGDMVYAIAPDAQTSDRGAAVLLFADRATIILIDGGVVERRSSSDGAVMFPQVVRQFVAERSGVR